MCIFSVSAFGQKVTDKKIAVVTAKSYNKVIAEDIVLIEFWATWCGPCRKLAPILKEISDETVVKVGKVNVDNYRAFVQQQGVNIVPTMIIYKDGKEVERLQGAYTKEELMDVLNVYINKNEEGNLVH